MLWHDGIIVSMRVTGKAAMTQKSGLSDCGTGANSAEWLAP